MTQTVYTMTEHGQNKDPELAIYCYTQGTLRAGQVAPDWDPESGSDDAGLAYSGKRSDILRQAWGDYIHDQTDATAREVIEYLLEDTRIPPFVAGPDGAYDTTRRTGDGSIQVWEERGQIHGHPVTVTYEIDPDDYTEEEREQAEYDWLGSIVAYRLR